MLGVQASLLLDAWERGLSQNPCQRALSLLALACPEMQPADLADLPIGGRDRHLLKLREAIFGQEMSCLVNCPGCGERLEICFRVCDVLIDSGDKDRGDGALTSICIGDLDIGFRLPNSRDLDAISECSDVGSGREILLRRCISTICKSGEEIGFDNLTSEALDAVISGMADADPQADVRIPLSCSVCGNKWKEGFDIASFLWRELDAWANRTLLEVCSLASAYGWSESEILALSPWRRQFYMEASSR